MTASSHYNLVVTIVNRGFSEQVMQAAKAVGACGGTILCARGAGNHEAESFLGISMHPEKEAVLILTEKSLRQAIMQSICHSCGVSTPARGFSFALPVDSMYGMLEQPEQTEAE